MGRIQENYERDKKIANFLRKTLDKGIKVLRDYDTSHGSIETCLEMASFDEPPFNGIIYDERIIHVKAPLNAIPIVDKKPDSFSDEKWKIAKKLCISHLELKEIIGNPSRMFYLGGYLNFCVLNAAAYQRDFCKFEGDILVIEDFSPAYENNPMKETMREFSSRNIPLIKSETAREIMGLDN